MRKAFAPSLIVLLAVCLLVQCSDSKKEDPTPVKQEFNGYESQALWGEHLLTVSGCHDCHSPKKMTAMGPDIDSSMLLAGHIAGSPEPVVNKKEMQDKGLAVTGDLTTWIGPWGTSYAANLTSDATGVGNWTEGQFMLALREGKSKGLPDARGLLPPMPWQMYRHFTDGEIKAIFAHLKTTKPIKNIVPEPLPPVAN